MAGVQFIVEAIEDIVALDGSVQPRVLKKILLLEQDPEAGEPLGSRSGTRLATFRRLVVGNRDWSIVYRIEPSGEVVVIWVVGDREDFEVYNEAAKRLEAMTDEPKTLGFEGFIGRLKRRARDVIE